VDTCNDQKPIVVIRGLNILSARLCQLFATAKSSSFLLACTKFLHCVAIIYEPFYISGGHFFFAESELLFDEEENLNLRQAVLHVKQTLLHLPVTQYLPIKNGNWYPNSMLMP